jgi:hypothetical protein
MAGIGPDLAPAGSYAQAAWLISAGAVMFVAVALAGAIILGIIETWRTRRAIDALRLNPSRTDLWSVSDWMSAFARTAVADRAEILAATIGSPGTASRIAVDTSLLVGLDGVWVDRLSLERIVTPIAPLLLAASAALALIEAAKGSPWQATVAAAAVGWLAIRLIQYLARMILMPGVTAAVDAATAALRPLTAIRAVESPGGSQQQIIDALLGPIGRLSDAAQALTAASRPPDRDQTIQLALADIRAGIERLLEAVEDPPD